MKVSIAREKFVLFVLYEYVILDLGCVMYVILDLGCVMCDILDLGCVMCVITVVVALFYYNTPIMLTCKKMAVSTAK